MGRAARATVEGEGEWGRRRRQRQKVRAVGAADRLVERYVPRGGRIGRAETAPFEPLAQGGEGLLCEPK